MDYENGSFVKKKNNFSMVSNYILRDNTISLKAKGLYSLIQSYITIDDFILYKKFLQSRCNEGAKAFESAWQELKKSGYLIQHKNRDGNKYFYYTYELIDNPRNLRAGFLYVMKNMGKYKIGRCNEKAKRLGEFTHLPEKPEYIIFEYVYDNVIVERELHKMFSDKRLRDGKCEWFELSEDDLEKIRLFVYDKRIEIPDRVNIDYFRNIIGD